MESRTWSSGSEALILGQDVDVSAARVTSDGVVLDPNGIQVSTGSTQEGLPAVAALGTSFYVPWMDSREEPYPYRWNIWGAQVAEDGIVSAEHVVSGQVSKQFDAAVAWNGSLYLVAWTDFRSDHEGDLYVGRVTAEGENLDGAGILVSAEADLHVDPRIGSNGDDFFVVWRHREGGDGDVYASRVTASGTVLDPEGFPVSAEPVFEELPVVAWDGDNYLVVWTSWNERSDVYGARVTPDGVVVDDPGFVISGNPWYESVPSVSWDGDNYLVAWSDARGADDRIYALPRLAVRDRARPRWDSDLRQRARRLEPVRCLRARDVLRRLDRLRRQRERRQGGHGRDGAGPDPDSNRRPLVVPQSERRVERQNYLVVWEDWRHGTEDILGTRVAPDGSQLDPTGFRIGGTQDGEYGPASAAGPAGQARVLYQRVASEPPYVGAQRIFGRVVDEQGPPRHRLRHRHRRHRHHRRLLLLHLPLRRHRRHPAASTSGATSASTATAASTTSTATSTAPGEVPCPTRHRHAARASSREDRPEPLPDRPYPS